MHRFYCLRKDISGEKIIIQDRTQVHHIKNVLKLKKNEKVTIFDEDRGEYNCVISEINDMVYLDIKKACRSAMDDLKIKLTVACAIPKKAKFDDIIDKLVQLGVYRVIPLITERVVVKLDRQKKLSRLERWQKIALSAAKQSQRSVLPVIEGVGSLKEVLAQAGNFDFKLIPTLEGERKSMREVFGSHLEKTPGSSVIVLIGPEGDFSQEEVKLARESGFIPVTLGDLVLRVDTAAVAVASFINLYAYH